MSNLIPEKIQALKKALEAGNYNAAPGALTQGAALQTEALDKIMTVVTFKDKAIKLQKELNVIPHKSTLYQFNRQLDYGQLGGSATLEGQVGTEQTPRFARIAVPMAFYSHVSTYTKQAELIESFDKVPPKERLAEAAAMKIAADVELHLFRGQSAYSNAGNFDGNPLAMSEMNPEMHGLDPQIRQSDDLSTARDLMLEEYGADISVVINQSGILTRSTVEDVAARSAMNNGAVDRLYLDPLTHAAYNRTVAHNIDRIFLAGSPQQASGASLKTQFVATGEIAIESSRFLSGKTKPSAPNQKAPNPPSISTATGSGSSALAAGTYTFVVTAANANGESAPSAVSSITITANQVIQVTITPASSGHKAYWYNVYRSEAGGAVRKFIGRVKDSGGATTIFIDLGKRVPGFVTGFALDMREIVIPELAPFSAEELAQFALAKNWVFYRFLCVAAKAPRFNVLIDNITA